MIKIRSNKKGSRIIKFSEQNQESQDIEKGLIDANSNVAHISFTPDGSRIFFLNVIILRIQLN